MFTNCIVYFLEFNLELSPCQINPLSVVRSPTASSVCTRVKEKRDEIRAFSLTTSSTRVEKLAQVFLTSFTFCSKSLNAITCLLPEQPCHSHHQPVSFLPLTYIRTNPPLFLLPLAFTIPPPVSTTSTFDSLSTNHNPQQQQRTS